VVATARADSCPTDPKGVQAWRDQLLAALEIPYESTFGFGASRRIVDCEKKSPGLFKRPEVQACMARTRDFLGEASKSPLLAPPAPAKSADDPDVRSGQVPDDLLDPAFLKLMTHRTTLAQAKEKLKQINAGKPDGEKYLFAEFSSQFVISPDEIGSPDRLVVFVPGTAQVPEDRFVLFSNNPASNDAHPARMISVASVQKTGANGKKLPAEVVRFKTYMRNYAPAGAKGEESISVRVPEKPLPYEMKCYSCHKTGLRLIFPAKGSLPDSDLPHLRKMNGAMEKYKIGSYGGVYRPEKWGPPMGIDAQSSPASRENFKACVAREFDGIRTRPAPSIGRVVSAARCTECHDGKDLGALNFPTGGISSDGDDVTAFVAHLKIMPADAGELSDVERGALARCLVNNYYGGLGEYAGEPKGQLASWLTQYGCESRSVTPAKGGGADRGGTVTPGKN